MIILSFNPLDRDSEELRGVSYSGKGNLDSCIIVHPSIVPAGVNGVQHHLDGSAHVVQTTFLGPHRHAYAKNSFLRAYLYSELPSRTRSTKRKFPRTTTIIGITSYNLDACKD